MFDGRKETKPFLFTNIINILRLIKYFPMLCIFHSNFIILQVIPYFVLIPYIKKLKVSD